MNRFAVITGGSAGIGLEMAKILAADRFDLLICGSSDHVFRAQQQLQDSGVQVHAVKSDLSTEEGADAVLEAILATKRPVDVAIFNAGIATGGASFAELPLQDHLRLIGINVLAPVRLAHALLPHLIKWGGGKIMFVSSLSALTPTPYEGVYGPSKSFLTSFGHGLREELMGTGVDVTIVHPGAIATGFHARAGMQDSIFGDNSWKNDPVIVARQSIDALMSGKTSVVAGDAATQEAGLLLKQLSDEAKAKRHAEMAKPRNSAAP